MTVTEYNLCVDEYSDRIYRFILKNLGNSDTAQDVVQDTYTKLWEKHINVDFLKAKSYLFTTAYHTMIDMIRKEKRSTDIGEIEPYLIEDNNTQYNDLKEILNMAIKNLSEVQRSALLLRDYEGYSYKEIEDITGLNENQVKVYIYRARKFLMNYIGSIEKVI